MSHKIFLFSISLLVIINVVMCDKKSDDYVLTTQSECYTSKKIFSCFKYRAARYIWSIATGRMNLFEHDNSNLDSGNGVRLVQLSEPEKDDLFPEARQSTGDNEVSKALKFFKRSISAFIAGHGVRIGIGNENGARIIDNENGDSFSEGRRIRKKSKWNLIFPLAILMKLTHLKLALLPVLLGIGTVQVLLIIGGALLFHFLRNNTLCKVQPHLIHTHSHVSETGPEIPYSSYQGYPYAAPSYLTGGHPGGYNKDWATNRAYSAYGFLDPNDKH